MTTRFFYESTYLYAVDGNGTLHKPKNRRGSQNSESCPDCSLRGALTMLGTPTYCADCREAPVRGKKKCLNQWCANGCEVCGGTGRVPR